MTARDTLIGILRQWSERHGAASQTPEALVAACDAELLRAWSVKIREAGKAKGWSTWAAAYLDPDLEFVETGMPSTETIVAELRRLDRAEVLREALQVARNEAERLETGNQDARAARGARSVAFLLRRMVDEAEKDTSGGSRPPAGESTPDMVTEGGSP